MTSKRRRRTRDAETMDSAPCSVIYFWLIKSARFFSLLCTVCQVHYLLTHKSSSLAKGKFPLCCEAAVSMCHKPHVHGAAPSALPRWCRRTRRTPGSLLALWELEKEHAKLCSSPCFSLRLLSISEVSLISVNSSAFLPTVFRNCLVRKPVLY